MFLKLDEMEEMRQEKREVKLQIDMWRETETKWRSCVMHAGISVYLPLSVLGIRLTACSHLDGLFLLRALV